MTRLMPVWATTHGGWLQFTSTTALLLGVGVLLTVCLLCLLPSGRPPGRWRQLLAVVSGVAGLVGLWTLIPYAGTRSAAASFWSLAALTLGAALATISAHRPVYSAIWFAVSLLGTAALFLLQGAQFLSLATVAVYAGAIVVTFLFVLMLAQPEGHAFYDRISRGFPTRVVATLTAVSLAMIVAASLAPADSQELAREVETQESLFQQVQTDLRTLHGDQVTLRSMQLWRTPSGHTRMRLCVAAPNDLQQELQQQLTQLAEVVAPHLAPRRLVVLTLDLNDVLTTHHMASLGSRLFTRHLVAVEVVGTLLLVALVGAIAMASRDASGRDLGARDQA